MAAVELTFKMSSYVLYNLFQLKVSKSVQWIWNLLDWNDTLKTKHFVWCRLQTSKQKENNFLE